MKASTLRHIASEAEEAAAIYGPFSSTHEALGVITEEFHELIEAIRSNDLAAVSREVLQVAAVAARLADQCGSPSEAFAKRSGVK